VGVKYKVQCQIWTGFLAFSPCFHRWRTSFSGCECVGATMCIEVIISSEDENNPSPPPPRPFEGAGANTSSYFCA